MPEPLKNWFNPARFRALGDLLAECHPGFDRREFMRRATTRLDPLSILGRMRHGTLAPRATVTLTKRQVIRDFTTRRHHPGRHRVEIQINGEICGGGDFVLLRAG